ncbi:MAG: GAF domain-containing protein [Leptolyngbyaceae cyanobacterium MAG.088]|nr:GAF domain-containing protein [Leptolyngbyaceae cyanobacterium MAG.088]
MTLLAIASMLPILAIGTATYQFGLQEISNRTNPSQTLENPERKAIAQQEQKLLITLLSGTGALALLTGAIVAYLAHRSMKSAMDASLPSATQTVQDSMSNRLQVVTAAFQTIHTKLSEDEIYTSIVEDVRNVLNLDRVVVYGLDGDFNEIVMAESVAPGWPNAIGTFIPDPCFQARYIEKYGNGRVKSIYDIHSQGLSPCYIEQLDTLEVKALVVAPIVCNQQLKGLLIGHQCNSPRDWQTFEVQWFKQIAAQVGFTITNLKLSNEHDSLQQQANTQIQWMQLFTETVQNIWILDDPDEIFNTTVRSVRNILDADRVIVYGLNKQSQEVVIAESIVPDWPSSIGAHIPDPCFKARYLDKYRKGRVKAIENIYEANLSPCYIEQLAVLKVKALLVAPIVSRDQLVGLLIAHQCYGARVWQEFEVQWFTQIATQVGLALDKAQNLASRSGEQHPISDWA